MFKNTGTIMKGLLCMFFIFSVKCRLRNRQCCPWFLNHYKLLQGFKFERKVARISVFYPKMQQNERYEVINSECIEPATRILA